MEQKGQTGEIVMYQPDETIRLEVRMDHETVWLNRQQMAALFDRNIKTIGKHINNALREELRNLSTVAKFAIVQPEGKRMISRLVEFYNLDMVLSVGYRVKYLKSQLQKSKNQLTIHIMELLLERTFVTETTTVGRLSIITRTFDEYLGREDKEFICNTIEPPMKVLGVNPHFCHRHKSAMPPGR